MTYVFTVGAIACIYAVLALSLNLAQGYGGVLTIAQAGFMGIGAYATANFEVFHGWPFVATVIVGMVISAGVAGVIIVPALRMRGFLQVIVTFAFMIVISNVFINANLLTQGPNGIAAIPPLSLLGWTASSNQDYFFAYGITLGALIAFSLRLEHSPLGLTLRAVRENEGAASGSGKNVWSIKIRIFVLSAAVAALAGSMYAAFIGYIDSTPFTVATSFLVVAMVVIGGSGSVWGSVVGAFALSLLPSLISLIDLPSTIGGALAQILFATILIVIVRFRPAGIIPESPWRGLVRALGLDERGPSKPQRRGARQAEVMSPPMSPPTTDA